MIDIATVQELCFLERQELLARFPAPREAVAHGDGTDIAGDLEVLWAAVMAVHPLCPVEIGTRRAVSTVTLVHALEACASLPGLGRGKLWTIDPDPECRAVLRHRDLHYRVSFICAKGEDIYERGPFKRVFQSVDFLFVDTDPHSYDQTKLWLDTWVQHRVPVGGVVAFHDVVAARPEIRVADAVRDFVSCSPTSRGTAGRIFTDGREDRKCDHWVWREYPSDKGGFGIGLLWRIA